MFAMSVLLFAISVLLSLFSFFFSTSSRAGTSHFFLRYCGSMPFSLLTVLCCISCFSLVTVVQSSPAQNAELHRRLVKRNETSTLTQGWTPSPQGRGTIDIIRSCVLTISLCTWSTLCVNLPAVGEGYWHMVRRKLYLVVIGMWGPEFIFMLAFGQYFSARQSAKDFHSLGYASWTITHAFFADMGGFVLQTEDFPAFPLTARQLHYLVKEKHVEFPSTNEKDIKHKNKAQSFVRIVTLLQISWFSMNCIGRAAQNLAMTTLELTTLAFIFCTFGSSFCWLHKPMDLETPVILTPATTMSGILARRGDRANEPWELTPLDFVLRTDKKEWLWNIGWSWILAVLKDVFRMNFRPKARPMERIPNDDFPQPPRRTFPLLAVIHGTYGAIQVIGWNFHLPTATERFLWRLTTTSTLVCILVIMLLDQYTFLSPSLFKEFVPGYSPEQNAPPIEKHHESWAGKHPVCKGLSRLAARMQNPAKRHPKWKIPMRILIPCIIFGAIYTLSRTYILLEDAISLRSLPSSAYETVDWSAMFPHF